MLPIIIDESNVSPFKFWFENALQDGIHHQDELYCRLSSFSAKERSKAYHLGCKIAQSGTVVVLTLSSDRCGLWISLRDPFARSVLSGQTPLNLPGAKPVSE
ncbi:MAG: hypothetical protein ACO3EZ_18935 [Prochlorotrichaceae cyanobacterium]